MIVYDATIDHFSSPIFPVTGKLIRCIYDHNGMISSLSGVHGQDGVYLYLSSRTGTIKETAYNPEHYHISILTKNAKAYADLFGTKRFIIEHNVARREDWSRKRFPEWRVFSTDSGYRMELDIE